MAKRKKHDDAQPKPAAPAVVSTSLKSLLSTVSLKKDDPKAKAAAGKPSGASAKPSSTRASDDDDAPKVNRQVSSKPWVAKPAGQAPAAPPTPKDPNVVPRPSDTLRGNDRIAFYDAIAGVRRLGDKRPPRLAAIRTEPAPPPPRQDLDAPARKKLGDLVSGQLQFDVAIDEDGFLEALRADAPLEALGALRRDDPRVDATLDLHGKREADVDDRLARWLREEHRKGARRVLIIHGKGLHSPDGRSVLRDAVCQVLEHSVATPLVLAFSSAPAHLGGTGATLVELSRERRS